MWVRPVEIERHAKGPRLFVFGRRLHECHAGLALLVAVATALLFEASLWPSLICGAIAAWMIVKDYRDLRAATRDTASWSWWIHRVSA